MVDNLWLWQSLLRELKLEHLDKKYTKKHVLIKTKIFFHIQIQFTISDL